MSESDTTILPTPTTASLPSTQIARFCPSCSGPRPSSGTITPGSIMSAPAERCDSFGSTNFDTCGCVTSVGMKLPSRHSVKSVGYTPPKPSSKKAGGLPSPETYRAVPLLHLRMLMSSFDESTFSIIFLLRSGNSPMSIECSFFSSALPISDCVVTLKSPLKQFDMVTVLRGVVLLVGDAAAVSERSRARLAARGVAPRSAHSAPRRLRRRSLPREPRLPTFYF